MIRVAFLEYEKETKDIIFELSKVFNELDWTFRHYRKASDLAKVMKKQEIHLFVFDEMMLRLLNTPHYTISTKMRRYEEVFI